jgi:hypothetical protein
MSTVLSVDIVASNRVIEGCIDGKTLKGYNSKMKYVLNWYKGSAKWKHLYFEKVNAEGLSEPNLKLPLEMESVQELFGKLAIDVDLPRQSKNTGQPVSGSPETLVQRRQQLLHRLSPDADVDVDVEAEEEEAEDANETIEIDVPDDVYAEKRRTISKSCMQGYKSALKHY